MARKPLPPPQQTHQIEREYFRHIAGYLAAYQAIMSRTLLGALPGLLAFARSIRPDTLRADALRTDAKNVDEELRKLFAKIQKRMEKTVSDKRIKSWNRIMVDRINRLSKGNMAAHVEKLNGAEIEPLLHDKGLSKFFDERVSSNVGLIRSIGVEKHPQLQKKLGQMIAQDATVKDIAQALQEHFSLSKKKAALIAQDQVGKLNGELDQHRQKQMGLNRYRWRTMRDLRVTGRPGGLYPDAHPSHWAREGKIYSWDDPPEGGHPKQRVRCRCYAEPVLEDLLD